MKAVSPKDRGGRLRHCGAGAGGAVAARWAPGGGVWSRRPSRDRGAGFLLQPSGLQVLWQMGLLEQILAHGALVRRLYGDVGDGRAVMEMRYHDLDRRLFGLGVQRGALFLLLRQAWQAPVLHVGTRIVAVDAEGGRLRSQDGRWHAGFDLVVAADGAASCLRAQAGPPRLDRPYPWGALWSPGAAGRLGACRRVAAALSRRAQDDRPVAGGHAPGRSAAAHELLLELAAR